MATPTCTTPNLPSSPTLTIYLTGLLGLGFEPSCNYCQVGVHNESSHLLRILLSKRTFSPTQATQVVFDSATRRRSDHVWLTIENPTLPAQSGVSIYDPNPGTPLDRSASNPDQHSFKWVVDLERDGFVAPGRPKASQPVLKPSIFITTGTFYTHKKTTTASVLKRVPVTGGVSTPFRKISGGPTTDFGLAAQFVAAAITLRPNDEIVVRVGDETGGRYEVFRAPFDPDATYEALIENGGPDKVSSLGPNDLADFVLYYSAFNITEDEIKYDLELPPTEVTIRIPCLAAVVSPPFHT
jgi:hypothetical protein